MARDVSQRPRVTVEKTRDFQITKTNTSAPFSCVCSFQESRLSHESENCKLRERLTTL